MKKKVGTILDEDLLNAAKQLAGAKKMTLSRLFEEALRYYLLSMEDNSKKRNVVYQTKGCMKISPALLKAVMDEESFYEA